MQLPAGTILGPYETREEWLKARRAGLGGSDIGAILGVSTFSSELEVYLSKVEGVSRETTEQMDIGREIEPWIASQWWFSQTEWADYDDDLMIIQSDSLPFLLHSPDALLLDGDFETPVAGLEIKNIRSDHNWDPIPEFYMAQVQHGLLCSGLDRWIVVALVGGQKLITREIEPDKEMQGRIALASERFWNTHILPQVPPEPDGSESAKRALERRWDTSHGHVDLEEGPVSTLRYYQERADKAEKDLNKAKQMIMAKMGDAEVANFGGKRFATWKVSTRTSIDTKRLRDEDSALAKKYEKTTPTRIFRLS